MPTFDLSVTSLREFNAALHAIAPGDNDLAFEVIHPRGAHALAVGIDKPVTVDGARVGRLLLRRHERRWRPSPCTARPVPASPRT